MGGASAVRAIGVGKLGPNAGCHCHIFMRRMLDRIKRGVVCKGCTSASICSGGPLIFGADSPTSGSISFTVIGSVRNGGSLLAGLISGYSLGGASFFLFGNSVISIFGRRGRVFSNFVSATAGLFTSRVPVCCAENGRRAHNTFTARFRHCFSPGRRGVCCAFQRNPVYFIILSAKRSGPSSSVRCTNVAICSRCQARRTR